MAGWQREGGEMQGQLQREARCWAFFGTQRPRRRARSGAALRIGLRRGGLHALRHRAPVTVPRLLLRCVSRGYLVAAGALRPTAHSRCARVRDATSIMILAVLGSYFTDA